ncbi:hypothetical protein BN988_02872 [Oceanobacillus picturae]|uniref:Uncharacterized protein n=1 Tax=Oceanobacillus picturae TaxID=171693 RepID=W9AFQ7_9BACI|nr:hypothetical protein BN988_02872 [Oceanobacillus picturae]
MKKSITQAIIYLVEVIIFLVAVTALYSGLENGLSFSWKEHVLTFQFLSNLGVIFVVYQLLIYSFISLHDSAKNDALLEIKSIIKLCILHSNYNVTLVEIEKTVDELLYKKKGYYMLSKKNIETLEDIESLIKRYNAKEIDRQTFHFWLEKLLIIIEHESEFNSLLWRNSLLLRLLK